MSYYPYAVDVEPSQFPSVLAKARLILYDVSKPYIGFTPDVDHPGRLVLVLQEEHEGLAEYLAEVGEPAPLSEAQLARLPELFADGVLTFAERPVLDDDEAVYAADRLLIQKAKSRRSQRWPHHAVIAQMIADLTLVFGLDAETLTDVTKQATGMQMARWVQLDTSAVRMLTAVLETPQWPEGWREPFWLEFAHATHWGVDKRFIGIFVYRFLDGWKIQPYNESYQVIGGGICYDIVTQQFSPNSPDSCPQKACIPQQFCASCWAQQQIFIAIFATTVNMLRGTYSLTYEAPVFRTTPLTWQEHDTRITEHGKKKSQWVEHTAICTLLSFDVSYTVLHGEGPEHDDPSPPFRQHWMTLYGIDEVVYALRDIDDYQRIYPIRRDGTRQEGCVPVSGGPRYVPMVADAKRRMGKKLHAQRYQ